MPRLRQFRWAACAVAVTQAACAGGGSKGADDTGAPALPAGAVVLDRVHVLDAAGARRDRAVVVVGDLVYAEQDAGGPWPAGATVQDQAGRWLVPGLIDAHVHLYLSGALDEVEGTLPANLAAQLAWGVVGVVDLGAPEGIFDLRDRIASGGLDGPRIFATGPFLTVPGSHPCELVNDRDQCRFVGEDGSATALALALGRADGLKVALADAAFTPWPTPRLDLGDLASITAAAPGPVFAHVDTPTDAADARAQGVAVLAHPVFSTPAAPPPGLPVTSTLSAFHGPESLLSGALLAEDLRHTPAAVQADWEAVAARPALLGEAFRSAAADWAAAATANVESWLQQDVVVLAGSDAGYLFVPHGLGLHQELARLQALGLPPAAVLAMATAAPAALLGWDDLGFVGAGYRADLLLLDADPTADVAALRAIHEVWLGGRPVDRGGLGGSTGAALCLSSADCPADQACDPQTWACADRCAEPWAVLDDCGADACVESSTGEALCRAYADCGLVAADCTPAWYGETCVPVDIDTNRCWPGGLAEEGEACDWEGGLGGCGPGLYCSPVSGRCLRHCDPAAPDCAADQTCVVQQWEGEDWFALCL